MPYIVCMRYDAAADEVSAHDDRKCCIKVRVLCDFWHA
jgi:hypothetical protein